MSNMELELTLSPSKLKKKNVKNTVYRPAIPILKNKAADSVMLYIEKRQNLWNSKIIKH